MWGLDLNGYLTEAPEGFWNARAIFKGSHTLNRVVVDLLGDRMGWEGSLPEPTRKEIADWLNTKGMKMLKEKLAEKHVGGADKCTITVSDDPFYLYADPNSSYGYLYIAAWKEAPKCHGKTPSTQSTNPPPA
jgi:hypothetical protein